MKKKTLAILSIVAVLLVVAIVVLVIAVNKSRDVDDPAEPTAKPTAAPTVEEPTAEPTEEPTPEPTAEPTADPAEELISLRDEALAAYSAIVEQVQYRFDVASEILEVAKGYPNFREDVYYQLLTVAKADFEENLLTLNIDNIVSSSIALNILISSLIEEHPELKTTEEFQKLVEAPSLDIASYNVAVAYYLSALSNSTSTDFEELPYCFAEDSKIEY